MERTANKDENQCTSEGSDKKTKEIHKAPLEFIFLIRGRNCATTIEKCIRSIRRQTYKHWQAVIALDAPTDNSEEITRKLIIDDDRFGLVINEKWHGVCKNLYSIIRYALIAFNPDDNTVGAIVDADDWISKDALQTVANVYRKYPNTLITHGSYRKQSVKRRTKISNPYPKSGNISKLPWRGSHLKCIKWKILKKAKSSWFQHKGKWLQAASDLALMFNSIEISGLHRVRHVHKIIYYWNDHPNKKKRILEKRCERILRNK